MKYRTRNLHDYRSPLPFPIKLVVEYRPGGVLTDYAPTFYSSDPERAVDELVKRKGWDRRPEFRPENVWVDGAL
jgi:hypothetical protein